MLENGRRSQICGSQNCSSKPRDSGFRKISYSFTIISVKRKIQWLSQLAGFQLGTLQKCKPIFLLFICWIGVLFLSLEDEKSSL